MYTACFSLSGIKNMPHFSFDSISHFDHPYHAEMTILPEWQHFWLTGRSSAPIYQAIVDRIINQPYVDTPNDLVRSGDTTIFHPNHDATHAVRQAINTRFFHQLILHHGNDAFKQVAASLTIEEQEALQLAAFLFRAGRTNELGGVADPKNAIRSAELFKGIAAALGFEPSLVQTFYYCIGYTYTHFKDVDATHLHEGLSGDDALKQKKFDLVKRLLQLSHHTDLVRCFNDEKDISTANQENLSTLISSDNVDVINAITLHYARASCEITGTPYFLHDAAQTRIIPPPYLKRLVLQDVGIFFERLTALSHSFTDTMSQKDMARSQQLLLETQSTNQSSALENKAASTIQRAYFAHRAHRMTQHAVGVDVPKVSKESLAILQRALQQGDGLSLEEKERKGHALLLDEEQPLYDYLLNHFEWTLKHITAHYDLIRWDGNSLKSLRQRNRENRFNINSHTDDREGRSDHVLFTIAGPNGHPVSFLRGLKSAHEIRIPIRSFFNEQTKTFQDQLSHLWLSSAWHYFGPMEQLLSEIKTQIDKTSRHVTFHQKQNTGFIQPDDYKLVHYRREDGDVYERHVSMVQETVTGQELLPFLASHVILELRYVGGAYRDDCLKDKTFRSIEPFVDTLFEGRNFEALIPSRLNLNDPRIEIRPYSSLEKGTPEQAKRMLRAIKGPNPEQDIQTLLDEGIPIDICVIQDTSALSLLLLTGYEGLIPSMRYLIQKGANTNCSVDEKSLLLLAVQHKLYEIVELILETAVLEKRDTRIKLQLHASYVLESVQAALKNHDRAMLTLFKKYGFNFAAPPIDFLMSLIQLPELSALDMLNFIQEAGFNAQSIAQYNDEGIYLILEKVIRNHKIHLLQALLEGGFNPNVMPNIATSTLLDIAEQLHQPEMIQLLMAHHAIKKTVTSPSQRVFLIIQHGDELLLAKPRKLDGTSAPHFQSIECVVNEISPAQIQQRVFLATGIRLEHFDVKLLVDEEHQTTAALVTLQGEKPCPGQTEQWANCRWLPSTAIDDHHVDKLTCALLQNPSKETMNTLLRNQTLLRSAIKEDDLSWVISLLSRGVSDTSQEALMVACDTNNPNLEIISALLAKGYDINARYQLGSDAISQGANTTPLMLAILHHRLDLVMHLVQNGANINQGVGLLKITPMMLAAGMNQIDTLNLLESLGASFKHEANRGILSCACANSCSDQMFHYLLEHADIDAQLDGVAPIIVVVKIHHVNRFEALLKKGAKYNIMDPFTHQALEYSLNEEERVIFEQYNTEEGNTNLTYGKFTQDAAHLYLSLTGKLDANHLQTFIQTEYDIDVIEDESELARFSHQLLRDSGFQEGDAPVKIAIAHSGDAPIFTCQGLQTHVIAIHKDFILNDQPSYQQLCFGVAHELAFIKRMRRHVIQCDAAKRIEFDQTAMSVCPDPKLSIDYLQRAAAFLKSHQSKLNFKWPTEKSSINQSFRISSDTHFEVRIKALRIWLTKHPEFQPHVIPETLPEALFTFVYHLQSKQYYSDFPEEGTTQAQYEYLLKHLPSLHDELLPFELTGQPSLRLKEFGRLLQQTPIDAEAIDRLLETAQDLKLPGFDYLYKSAGRFDVLMNSAFTTKKIQPLGYFKKMMQAMLAFKNATTLAEAKVAADNVMALYPIMVEHGHHAIGASDYMQFYFEKDKQNPLRRYFGSDLGHMIDWEMFSHALDFQNHITWAAKEGQAHPHLWQCLWIMGFANKKRLYDVMPKDMLLQLPKQTKIIPDFQLIPRPFLEVKGLHGTYPSALAATIYPYFSKKTVDSSRLKTKSIEDFKAFIQTNYAQLTTMNRQYIETETHDRPAVHQLLDQLAILAKGTTEEQQWVRDFYLREDDPSCLPKIIHSYSSHIISMDSTYVQFLLSHSDLFTPNEIFKFLKNTVDVHYLSEFPTERWLQLLHLENNGNSDLVNFLAAIEYLSASGPGIPAIGMNMFERYLDERIRTGLTLNMFSAETYQLLDSIHHSSTLYYITGNHWGKMRTLFAWPPVESCPFDTHQLVNFYRIIQSRLDFPNDEYRQQLAQHVLTKIRHISDPKTRIERWSALMYVKNSASRLAIQDRAYFKQIASYWVQDVVSLRKKDDGSRAYAYEMNELITDVFKNSTRIDALYLFDQLSNAIDAQAEVCAHIKRLVEPDNQTQGLKQSMNNFAIVTEALSCFNKNQADKKAMLEFISSPLSKRSLSDFYQYIILHPKSDAIYRSLGFNSDDIKDEMRICFCLSNLHQQFWDLKLEYRAIALDSLIITTHEETTDALHQASYLEGFDFMTQKLFPNAATNERESFGLALLTAYLETADQNERQFLLAGLLVANKDADEQTSSIGRKLASLLEHLGPAYVKLAQAVHSHPNTPEDIKADLAHVKGHANPPYRWNIWHLMKQVLPQEALRSINHLGSLLGAASYNLALKYKTMTHESQVLLLLRENAAADAKKGFLHLQRALEACHHPLIDKTRTSMRSMISEASDLSQVELDHTMGDKQHQLAATYYQGKTKRLKVADTTYTVVFEACKSLASGPGYRSLTLMPGIEFNDLPNASLSEKRIRKAIALAVFEKELCLILSGQPFDCDRHGNQFRVEIKDKTIHLGLYDFGEMSLEPLSAQEIESLAALVYQFPKVLKRQGSIDALFQEHIQRAVQQGEPCRHLMRVNKALLALQDIQKELTPPEIIDIFQNILPRIHPVLAKALKKGAYEQMSALELSQSFFSLMHKTVKHALENDDEMPVDEPLQKMAKQESPPLKNPSFFDRLGSFFADTKPRSKHPLEQRSDSELKHAKHGE